MTHPSCETEGCRRDGTLHYKLDARNWSERRARLCTACARRLGYARVEHERPARQGTWVSGRTRGET